MAAAALTDKLDSLLSSLSQPPSVPRDERSIVLALTCGCSLLRSVPLGKRWEMSWLHKQEVGSAGTNVSDVLLGECRKACVISPLGQPAQTSECGGPDRSIDYIKGGRGPGLGLPDAREALDPRAGPAECKLIYRNRFWRSKPSLTGEGKCVGWCYCQFTNISMGRSIGQASSGALGNSSIVPAIRTDGNSHLHVGI